MENLSSLVREREGVERKLSTTYSLGRDRISLPLAPVLPVYDGSYSFRGSKTESVTIFHRFSSSTSSSDISGSGSDSQQDFQREVELAAKGKGKGKAKEARETTSSSSTEDNNDWEEFYGSSSRTSSGSRGFIDSFHNVRTLESGSRRPWLFRRRSLSSTY